MAMEQFVVVKKLPRNTNPHSVVIFLKVPGIDPFPHFLIFEHRLTHPIQTPTTIQISG